MLRREALNVTPRESHLPLEVQGVPGAEAERLLGHEAEAGARHGEGEPQPRLLQRQGHVVSRGPGHVAPHPGRVQQHTRAREGADLELEVGRDSAQQRAEVKLYPGLAVECSRGGVTGVGLHL